MMIHWDTTCAEPASALSQPNIDAFMHCAKLGKGIKWSLLPSLVILEDLTRFRVKLPPGGSIMGFNFQTSPRATQDVDKLG